MSEIAKGYKKTEIGVIPEDWEVREFREYFNIISGKGFSKSEYTNDGIKLLRIDNVSYGKITWDTIAYLPKYYQNNYKNLVLSQNDILLALNRPITQNKLKIAILSKDDTPSILYQRVGKIIFLDKNLNKYFFYSVFNKYIKDFVEKTSVGSDQPFISTVNLKKIKLIIPPQLEQNAIAEALSDTDSLISSLEKLIDKKKKIKDGAMQELLTGKKRLAGFSGEWEIKRLGELLDYEQPTKYIVENEDYGSDKNIPVLTAGKSFVLGYTDEEFGIFENYPVIIFDDFTTASKFVNFKFKVKSSAMKILKLKNENDNIRLIYELMQNIKFQVGDHKRHWISEFSNIEIEIPATKEEQTAIAQILSDMDSEISSLETKLEKYRQIKQGMMQELLTGRIRII